MPAPSKLPERRSKDKFIVSVTEHAGGCLFCGDPEVRELDDGGERLGALFCDRHVRWAMAARRERVGKQARTLRRLLLAHCRLTGCDPAPAKEWLGF